MNKNLKGYAPIYEFTRGQTVESVHFGAVAVVDVFGNLRASYGDPQTVTFLRSSAKPFQAMPFITRGGHQTFQLSEREIAVLCASHSGTDEHVEVVSGIQKKTGVGEAELLCGTHPPYHGPTAERLRERKEPPSTNRHNCSGKHTGMLAYTRLMPASDLPYIDFNHPLQREILETFAQMCDLPLEEVKLGIDGCSAPNFAVPLRSAALAFARMCDPEKGKVSPAARAAACKTIVSAMTSHPDMVGGPGRFDTRLMEIAQGRIVCKAGAEGYEAIGIMPGVLGEGSPALGIALKVADGDARSLVRTAFIMEVLRQMEALSAQDLAGLAEFGPGLKVHNWRKIAVGEGRPIFQLKME